MIDGVAAQSPGTGPQPPALIVHSILDLQPRPPIQGRVRATGHIAYILDDMQSIAPSYVDPFAPFDDDIQSSTYSHVQSSYDAPPLADTGSPVPGGNDCTLTDAAATMTNASSTSSLPSTLNKPVKSNQSNHIHEMLSYDDSKMPTATSPATVLQSAPARSTPRITVQYTQNAIAAPASKLDRIALKQIERQRPTPRPAEYHGKSAGEQTATQQSSATMILPANFADSLRRLQWTSFDNNATAGGRLQAETPAMNVLRQQGGPDPFVVGQVQELMQMCVQVQPEMLAMATRPRYSDLLANHNQQAGTVPIFSAQLSRSDATPTREYPAFHFSANAAPAHQVTTSYATMPITDRPQHTFANPFFDRNQWISHSLREQPTQCRPPLQYTPTQPSTARYNTDDKYAVLRPSMMASNGERKCVHAPRCRSTAHANAAAATE